MVFKIRSEFFLPFFATNDVVKSDFKKIEFFVFLGYLLLGFWIVGDYGISWDEPLQRNHGLVSMDYVNEVSGGRLFKEPMSSDLWAGYPYKDHGVIFQLTCLSIEKGFGITDYRSIFLIRHIIGFIVFSIGLFSFYFLLKRRWGVAWALTGFLFVVLSPRIFAHSFFNPKDTIALAWYSLCLLTGVKFLEKSSWRNALIHAVATALLVNSRLFGVYILFTTCGLYILNQILHQNWKLKKWHWGQYVLYVVATIVFIHLIWPNMWEDPINNLYYGLRRVSKYHWLGEILFFGHWVPAQNIPWYYLPIWISITTPVLYLIGFVLGIVLWGLRIIKDSINLRFDKINGQDFAVAVFTMGPILAVVLKESVMYDGWRHMYFIYGGIIYFGVYGFSRIHEFLKNKTIGRRAIPILIGINSLVIGGLMIVSHPNQNAYNNKLLKQPSIGQFEADYWGTSFKQLLEELHLKYPEQELYLYSRSEPLYFNYLASSEEMKRHIKVIPHDEFPPEGSYLYCSIFRGKYDQHLKETKDPVFDNPVVEIAVGNNIICGAYAVDPVVQ